MTTPPRMVVMVLFLVSMLAAVLLGRMLLQPEPNTQKCAALVGPESSDAEREAAFRNPLCAELRDLIR